MRLLVVNPNATASMTETIAAAARGALPLGEILARTNAAGPPAIQGPEDGAAAIPGFLNELRAGIAEGADAGIVACFDDVGLLEARAETALPIVGLCEAACHAAMLTGRPYSVVTTLAVAIPVIEANIERYGVGASCRRVRAAGVPVLALEDPESGAAERVSDEIERALAEDGAGAIVLGCAGMADLAADLSARHGVPVIDGVVAATGMAATLVRILRPLTHAS
ncbi:MAG: aspartate/glutamate racemase family protein [Pseudomonadota bacterium]